MEKLASGWVLVGTLLALGCGTSDKNPATAAGAAGQAVGGASSGSGGAGAGTSAGGPGAGQGGSAGQNSGGSLMLGDTPAEACIAYALAVCSRQVECGNGSVESFPLPSCIVASLGCPDTTFSPGATRTVAGLKACAEDYRTWPCDKVLADELPPCVTPGERTQSELCVYSSQCGSLNCEGFDGCGQCALEAADGESCAAPDVDCAGDLQCSDLTQTCVPIVYALPPAGPNASCDAPGQGCIEDYYCKAGAGGSVCSPLPQENEPCIDPAQCGFGAYCSPEQTCKSPPGMGEPCGISAFTNLPMYCQDPLTCHFAPDGMSGTCLPFPKLGEPCIASPTIPGFGFCGEGLRCDQSATPAVCAGPAKLGDSCSTSSDCQGYTLCTCPADMPACTVRQCIGLRFAGEPCGEPNYECHPAFECTAGVCQPRELQGTFAETCGG